MPYIEAQESSSRLLEAMKLFYAYFITQSELAILYSKFNTDFLSAEAQKLYEENYPWFAQFQESGEFTPQSIRPFFWKYETLQKEFDTIMSDYELPLFRVKYKPDYSSAVQSASNEKVFSIDWLEEHGFVVLDGVAIARTIQSLIIEDTTSELVALAIPENMTGTFMSDHPIVPGFDGGGAFEITCYPAHFNVNYAYHYGINNVNTIMLRIGDSSDSIDLAKCYDASVEIGNGIKVPFIGISE